MKIYAKKSVGHKSIGAIKSEHFFDSIYVFRSSLVHFHTEVVLNTDSASLQNFRKTLFQKISNTHERRAGTFFNPLPHSERLTVIYRVEPPHQRRQNACYRFSNGRRPTKSVHVCCNNPTNALSVCATKSFSS